MAELPLAPGQPRGHLQRRRHHPVAYVADLLLQACEAIGEAHTHAIIHRVLKPGNLFVTNLQVLEESGVVRTEKVGRVRTCRIEPRGLRLAEKWIVVGDKRISVSLATVEIEPHGDGTHLTYTEQGAFLDGHDDSGSRERGTHDLLDRLDAALKAENGK